MQHSNMLNCSMRIQCSIQYAPPIASLSIQSLLNALFNIHCASVQFHRSIQYSVFTSNSVSVFQCLFNSNCMMRWQDASCNWMHLQFTLHLQYVLCVAPCVFYYSRQLGIPSAAIRIRQLGIPSAAIRIRQLMTLYDAILTNGGAMVQLSRVKPRGEHPSGHTAQRDTRTSIQGRMS